MKSKPLPFWCVCFVLVTNLLTGGCSSENSEQSYSTQTHFAPQDHAVAMTTGIAPEPLVAQVASTQAVLSSALAWDALERRRVVNEGDGPVLFDFQMKNVSRETVVIQKINVSCGCTTVDTRDLPMSLAPGMSENIQISMNTTGKYGTVTKSILVQGSHNTWTLLVTAEITPPLGEITGADLPSGNGMSPGSRSRNIRLATSDRQAVFKGDCAACHSRFAQGQFGYVLYLGACAICHDAEHRASMVPDLRIVDESRDADYWRSHITNGIEGTLMPAFAKEKGGILTDSQIESLVKYLIENPLEPKNPLR